MTGRERFLHTLQGKIPDRVPMFDFISSKNLIKHFTGSYPTGYLATDIMQVTVGMGFDAAVIPYGGFANADVKTDLNIRGYNLLENQYIDEWGVVFEQTPASWPGDAPVIHPIKDREDFKKYFKVPDPNGDFRLEEIRIAQGLNKEYDRAIIGIINGPFTISLMEMGLENISLALYDDEALLGDMMDEVNKFLIPAAKNMIRAGVDAVLIAEDLAHAGGTFFRPEMMKKVLFPRLKDTVKAITEEDSYAILHTCGNVTEIFEAIVNLGVHAVNPVQASAGMDIISIKEKYGDKITLIGNLDSSTLLPYGSKEEIEAEVSKLMRYVAKGGRYIFCSDSDLRDDIPLTNMFAMFEAAKKIANY